MHSFDFNKFPLRILLAAVAVAMTATACRSTPDKAPPAAAEPVTVPAPAPAPLPAPPPASEAAPPSRQTPVLTGKHLRRGQWTELPGWQDDDPAAAWQAFLTHAALNRFAAPTHYAHSMTIGAATVLMCAEWGVARIFHSVSWVTPLALGAIAFLAFQIGRLFR